MKSLIGFFIILFFPISIFADGISLIEDSQNQLFVFDKGHFKQLEHNKSTKMHVGRNFAVYIDYLGNLKVYYDQKVTRISESVEDFTATENLITWKVANYLYVWQDGIKKEISRDARMVRAKGEIIYFEDEYDNALKIYYQHEVYLFAQNHYSLQTKALSVGRGSVAVKDGDDQLFVFVKGNMQVKKFTDERIYFSAGSNGVLVKNVDYGELQILSGSDVETVEYFAPKWFKSVYSWMVWVDNAGNFNVYEDGNKQLLAYQKPTLIDYSPKGLLYENGGQLYVYSHGREQFVCEHVPQNYAFFNDLFVYHTRQNQVEVVYKGSPKTVSAMPGVKFELHFDVINLYEGYQRKIFYQGNVYHL
ncbi:MAG: hypothetical protein C0599_06945 [Salinivirgaceae bacterium]|nr:MAG: hypothetical protein C0599_06945 [Salinivirgaceae bacterium]